MDISDQIQGILDSAPKKAGCYLMKDSSGKVIYVGKAVNLRNRLRSYYHASARGNQKTSQMVARISDIDWIVVGSELEALILEMTLIKKHRPHFNVRLKDDKRYPYVKVHWADPFPKLTVTRQMVNDGSRYFGPYTSVWAVHQTLDVLRHAKQHRPAVLTKTSLMLGLGERDSEIMKTMDDLRAAGVDILTLGQYLRPTAYHLAVERYVTPDEFEAYRAEGLDRGFVEVVAGPMVRSSYRAEQVLQKNNVGLVVG